MGKISELDLMQLTKSRGRPRLRENNFAPGYQLVSNDKAARRERERKLAKNVRKRAPGDALPPVTDIWALPAYEVGMGDTPAFYRPGSQDFLACPSLGIGA